MNFKKSVSIFMVLAALSGAFGIIPAYGFQEEEIAAFAKARDIRVDIENYLHKEIYPPRIYRSSTITNLHNFHGELDQKIEVNLEKRDCAVRLAFSGDGIVWEVASRFLMNSVEQILTICRERDFRPDRITITVYQNGNQLLGTGTYDNSDGMIRAIPPKAKKGKKARK